MRAAIGKGGEMEAMPVKGRRLVEPAGDVHPDSLAVMHFERRTEECAINTDCRRIAAVQELAYALLKREIIFPHAIYEVAAQQGRNRERWFIFPHLGLAGLAGKEPTRRNEASRREPATAKCSRR